MSAVTYSYNYDDIGNRTRAVSNAVTCTYSANQLNQYYGVTNAGAWLPLTYDLDGNMTRNGARSYNWDAENNLKRAGVLVTSNGNTRVDSVYDYMKRRTGKSVTVLTGYIPFTGIGQGREARRLAESAPMLAAIKGKIEAQRPHHLPKSLTGNAISYALDRWDALTLYVRDGKMEIDNNLVENAIRPSAIGKKNWLFFGSESGGWQNAVMYTVVQNCKMHGINPEEYLKDVLGRLPHIKAETDACLVKSLALNSRLLSK